MNPLKYQQLQEIQNNPQNFQNDLQDIQTPNSQYESIQMPSLKQYNFKNQEEIEQWNNIIQSQQQKLQQNTQNQYIPKQNRKVSFQGDSHTNKPIKKSKKQTIQNYTELLISNQQNQENALERQQSSSSQQLSQNQNQNYNQDINNINNNNNINLSTNLNKQASIQSVQNYFNRNFPQGVQSPLKKRSQPQKNSYTSINTNSPPIQKPKSSSTYIQNLNYQQQDLYNTSSDTNLRETVKSQPKSYMQNPENNNYNNNNYLQEAFSQQIQVSQFESESKPKSDVIINYLRDLGLDKEVLEVEDLPNEVIKRDLINLEDQMKNIRQIIMENQKQLQMSQNKEIDYYLEKNIENQQEILKLTKKIQILYQDKLSLRQQIDKQNFGIDQLSEIILNLYEKLSKEVNELKNFKNLQPSEREITLQDKVKELELLLDSEKQLRIQIEKELEQKTVDFKTLFIDAQEAKKIVLEQLNEIRIKKQELEMFEEDLKMQQQQIQQIRTPDMASPIKKASQTHFKTSQQLNSQQQNNNNINKEQGIGNSMKQTLKKCINQKKFSSGSENSEIQDELQDQNQKQNNQNQQDININQLSSQLKQQQPSPLKKKNELDYNNNTLAASENLSLKALTKQFSRNNYKHQTTVQKSSVSPQRQSLLSQINRQSITQSQSNFHIQLIQQQQNLQQQKKKQSQQQQQSFQQNNSNSKGSNDNKIYFANNISNSESMPSQNNNNSNKNKNNNNNSVFKNFCGTDGNQNEGTTKNGELKIEIEEKNDNHNIHQDNDQYDKQKSPEFLKRNSNFQEPSNSNSQRTSHFNINQSPSKSQQKPSQYSYKKNKIFSSSKENNNQQKSVNKIKNMLSAIQKDQYEHSKSSKKKNNL